MQSDFEKCIEEALITIKSLPEEQQQSLLNLVEETRRRHEENIKNAQKASEAVDDLTLNLEYLRFDIACRINEALGAGRNHK